MSTQPGRDEGLRWKSGCGRATSPCSPRTSPRRPMHNATLEIFEPGRLRVRLRRARGAHRRPDRLRAALPPARPPGARAASPTRCGSTTTTSTSATTYAARRCRARARWTSCASWRPGSCRAGSTPTGRSGRSTSSRGSRAAGWRCSRSPTRSWSTGSRTVDLGQVLLDVDPGPRTLVHEGWVPAPRAHPDGAGPGRRRGVGAAPAGRGRDGASTAEALGRAVGEPTARVGSVAGALSNRAPLAGVAVQPRRRPRSAGSSWCAPRSRTTARSAGCTAAPSTTSSSRPSPARCACG